MTRLFLSLYLLIVIGLFAIGWVGEQLWQSFNQNNQQTENNLILVKKLMPVVMQSQMDYPELVKQLEHIFAAPVKILTLQDIAFPPEQLNLLTQGEVISSYDNQDRLSLYIYRAEQNKIIEIGPMLIHPAGETSSRLRYFLQSASYLALALFIAAWTWPLWRDLRKLQTASRYFAQGLFEYTIPIKKRSAVFPLADSFQSMASQIHRLIEEQRQLVNAVSHDLRTPLSRIRFSLGMLSNEAAVYIPEVKQDVDELEQLIDELLNYARLDSQTQRLNLDYVNINELVHNQVEKLQKHANKQIQIQITGAILWLCDGHLIERAIQNLLTNAVRYSKNKLLVSAFIKQEKLIINIEDDGEGIDSSQYQTVFKPFSRLDTSRNKNTAGFGLGLAIVKKVCDWHQGACFISRSLMGGAKFTIELPLLNTGDVAAESNDVV